MTWVGLQYVIVVFPDHTHLLCNGLYIIYSSHPKCIYILVLCLRIVLMRRYLEHRKHNDNNNNSMAVFHDQDIICMFETGFLHIWLVKYSVI